MSSTLSLAQVQSNMSLYGLSTFLILGTVGNLLMGCILMQRTHRRNSCSLYLLSATVVNFILIQCILPLAIYSANNIDPQNVSLAWCKVRSYLFNALLMLYRWYKIAACADRAAMCNHRASVRAFSQALIARRVILIITIVWLIIPIHLALFFNIESGRCIPQSGLYAKLFSAYSIIISGWSPPILMASFGIITFRNLKKIRQRVTPLIVGVGGRTVAEANIATPAHQRVGNRDQQLMVLLICEVFIYIATNLLYSINITYSAVTANDVKTIDRLRIEAFVAYFSTPFLILINNCSPFYVYLIVSNKFRKDVKEFLSCCYNHQIPATHVDPHPRVNGATVLSIDTRGDKLVATRGDQVSPN